MKIEIGMKIKDRKNRESEITKIDEGTNGSIWLKDTFTGHITRVGKKRFWKDWK